MAESTFENFPVTELRRLVENEWARLHDDKQRMKARLRDEFPEWELQVHVLSVGLDIGASSTPSSGQLRQSMALEASRLSQLLVARYGLQEQAARWSVAAWGYALGRWSAQAVSSAITAGSANQWLAELDRQEQAGVIQAPPPRPTVGPTVYTEVDQTPTAGGQVQPVAPVAGQYGSAAATIADSVPAGSLADVATPTGERLHAEAAPNVVEPPSTAAGPPQRVPISHRSRRWIVPAGVGAALIVVAGAIAAIIISTSSAGAVKPVWAAAAGQVNSQPVVAQGFAFVGTGSSVKAFRIADGRLLWTKADPDGRPPFLTTGGGGLYAVNGNRIYRLNMHNGSIEWRFRTQGLRSDSLEPPAYGDGLVFTPANRNNRLYAVRATTGAYVTYIFSAARVLLFYEPTVGDGKVFMPQHFTSKPPGQ
ncbi:MAG TPA: PQQ-binding-like beta-propeller repeat protein, partial [Chloroflexota bacterium]|nr:PQQ-binding-like beta-propeller repeat protein [Chloroflexota bacterium]